MIQRKTKPGGKTPSASTGRSAADWQSSAAWVSAGRRIVLFVVGGALLVSAIVTVSGAVVATGSVTVESNYQVVQHPTGGVVREILVRNGDRVAAGQTLIRLDPTRARADFQAISNRVADLTIQAQRLIAERDGHGSFRIPTGLDATDPAVQQAFEAQQALFQARRTARLGEQAVLDQKLRQLDSEIRSLKVQHTSRRRERAINGDELDAVLPLFERGYVSRQRIAPLQREAARLDGEIGRIDAQISKMQSGLAEARLRKAQADKQFMNEVVNTLSRVQAALQEERQKRDKVADTLKRIDIAAPRAGFVHDLTVKTIGGVIEPAKPIAQVIPIDDTLIVEAQIAANEIDRVRPGQTAQVLFPAFNARTTPRVDGELVRLSPAELVDREGRATYTARIRIPPDEILKIGAQHKLVPGMPAQVFIETQSRSILSFILKPLSDAMGTAFRER